MVMTTLDKIMVICRDVQHPERYRKYLETLPALELEQRLRDLLASEVQHGWRELDSMEHRELTNA
jgi:hypothetical protein